MGLRRRQGREGSPAGKRGAGPGEHRQPLEAESHPGHSRETQSYDRKEVNSAKAQKEQGSGPYPRLQTGAQASTRLDFSC